MRLNHCFSLSIKVTRLVILIGSLYVTLKLANLCGTQSAPMSMSRINLAQVVFTGFLVSHAQSQENVSCTESTQSQGEISFHKRVTSDIIT